MVIITLRLMVNHLSVASPHLRFLYQFIDLSHFQYNMSFTGIALWSTVFYTVSHVFPGSVRFAVRS